MEYIFSTEGQWLAFMLCLILGCCMMLIVDRIVGNVQRKIKRCIRSFRKSVPARKMYRAQLRRLRSERRKVARRVLRTLLDILGA